MTVGIGVHAINKILCQMALNGLICLKYRQETTYSLTNSLSEISTGLLYGCRWCLTGVLSTRR